MMYLLLLFAWSINAQVCDKSLNDPVSQLNYEGCNNAGTCSGNRRTRCICCNKSDPSNWCFNVPAAQPPYLFTGTTCTTVTYKYAVTFGWRFEFNPPSDLSCSDVNGGESGRNAISTPILTTTINAAFQLLGYDGQMLPAGCQTCTPENPCDFSGTGAVTSNALTAGFATELNTYYDSSCATFQIDTPADCAANTDLGVSAYAAFVTARGDTNSPTMQLTTMFNSLLTSQNPQCSNPAVSPACLGWTTTLATVFVQNDLDSERENFIITTEPPTPNPTEHPTDPTEMPTATPTVPQKCFKYTNRVLDHKFLGSAAGCRGGIDERWPGGRTCDSPYIICLPAENTPANPDPTEVPNFGQSLPATDYSLQECLEECAFDQRCMGIELIPERDSARGACMLIDDILIELQSPGAWPDTAESTAQIRSGLAVSTSLGATQCCPDNPTPVADVDECRDQAYMDADANYFSFTTIGNLCSMCKECENIPNALYESFEITGRLELGNPANYNAMTDLDSNAVALCFAKMDYCNPYFEASDLDEEMLECYCPNNRKGTYTKKVKRTVANTKYCDESDPNLADINERIMKAQANRMFHLCENWCLFETGNPQTESWYWNPWHKCWREQYAGVGTHRSYCNRVIRDPMTIEQQFINYRSDNFCVKNPTTGEIESMVTEEPTGQPSTFDSTWYLAGEEDSCDDACSSRGKNCDDLTTNSLQTGSDSEIQSAYSEATSGGTCTSVATGEEDWALPGVHSDGTCLLRHPNTEYTGCNWAIGKGYQRLCACY